MIKQVIVKIAQYFARMNFDARRVDCVKHFRGAICEYEQTVGEGLTCSLPFLSCHDQVSQLAPQSGIDPKEYLIAFMVSQNRRKKKSESVSSFSDSLVPYCFY